MLAAKEGIKANEMSIRIFATGQYEGDVVKMENGIAQWLNQQPDDVRVYDVKYVHNVSSDCEVGVVSVAIIYGTYTGYKYS